MFNAISVCDYPVIQPGFNAQSTGTFAKLVVILFDLQIACLIAKCKAKLECSKEIPRVRLLLLDEDSCGITTGVIRRR